MEKQLYILQCITENAAVYPVNAFWNSKQ